MKTLLENFPNQLIEALRIAKKTTLTLPKNTYKQIVISGLGGSGIGATIVQEFMYDKCSIPFTVNKNYFIPASTNKDTLFIACSYSGNTEETLDALKEAKAKKATICCITSGGAMAEYAVANKLDLILIPGGMPPRSCLGYSLVQLLNVFKKTGLLKSSFERDIAAAIQMIQKDTLKIQKNAMQLAAGLLDKQVAIYGIAGNEGLMIRFRQQLNENSKALAWHNVIPEMTHNEIVGWKENHDDVAVIFCSSKNDYPRSLTRLDVLKKVVKKYTKSVFNLEIKGQSHWERVFYFIHLTDWVSVYLADLYKHDAVEVKVIDHLKGVMSKK